MLMTLWGDTGGDPVDEWVARDLAGLERGGTHAGRRGCRAERHHQVPPQEGPVSSPQEGVMRGGGGERYTGGEESRNGLFDVNKIY